MGTISIRFISEDDVIRWEKLEAKGKIGPKQAKMLSQWRHSNGNPSCNVVGNALIESARRNLKEKQS